MLKDIIEVKPLNN